MTKNRQEHDEPQAEGSARLPSTDVGSATSIVREPATGVDEGALEVAALPEVVPVNDRLRADASWNKDDLLEEAARRGLTVEGTGHDGAVLKADLLRALGIE